MFKANRTASCDFVYVIYLVMCVITTDARLEIYNYQTVKQCVDMYLRVVPMDTC